MRLSLLILTLLAACDGSGQGLPDGAESGITPAPHGGGYCCPIDESTCNCFRNGGWIADATDMCPSICDLAPVDTYVTTDDHGCQQLQGPTSCLDPQ
jgi:hypothetical protein